ncbi:hypothetical protein BU17DRAFT_86903 [Hysterangium stoloniferum]|nr:hypothetical protein BU17DRAFT_86903 [Hysterangium stoloniferum]
MGTKKKSGYTPSLKPGCMMALWNKSVGVLFGGIYDEDKGEDGLESTYYNDLYAYQMSRNGRWSNLTLRKPKKTMQVPPPEKKQYAIPHPIASPARYYTSMDEDGEQEGDEDDEHLHFVRIPTSSRFPFADIVHANDSHPPPASAQVIPIGGTGTIDVEDQIDPNDPSLTVPLAQYNAMLSVLQNTLHMAAFFESHTREYTLDDFHALNFDKMDHYVCLKQCKVVIGACGGNSNNEDDDDNVGGRDGEGDSKDDNESEGEKIVNRHVGDSNDEDDGAKTNESDDNQVPTSKSKHLRRFNVIRIKYRSSLPMGVSKDNGPRPEDDAISNPLPGETLALFYAGSHEWLLKRLDILLSCHFQESIVLKIL